MEHSESIAAISAALAKAQGEMGGARKDAANPHFRSKYADLASVWEACRDALSKNGIAVVQSPALPDPRAVAMTTILAHSSGEFFKDTLVMPISKPDAQGVGSGITYARRYALAAMVGVAPEDDDGNAAVGRGSPMNGNARLTDEQIVLLQGLADASQADLQKFCAHFKVPHLAAITPAQFPDAEAALRKKLSQRQQKEAQAQMEARH